MKLKVRPEDFVVEERIDLRIRPRGPYTILKLVKSSWNTLDAIDRVARTLGISRALISRCGLKDRYALTTQYLSYRGDLKAGFEEKNLKVEVLGKSDQPVSPKALLANRFKVTLRSLDRSESESIGRNRREVAKWGMPNYFDDQRFGSAWHRKGFFGKSLVLGHCEGALKLLLCHPYADEPKPEKDFKEFCREHWGEWDEIFLKSPRQHQRLIAFLVQNPNRFREAIKQVDREFLNLYLQAYQSYIFNEALSMLVREHGQDLAEVAYSVGRMAFYRALDGPGWLPDLYLPMVSEKTNLAGPAASAYQAVLDREGVRLKDFALSRMRFRGVRFKPFVRRAIVLPAEFLVRGSEPDDLYPGKEKVRIEFDLPAGSYATVLVKRLLI